MSERPTGGDPIDEGPSLAAFRKGAARSSPLAFGVLVYGVAFGILASGVGLAATEIVAMGLLVFAGSAQIVAVERLAAEAGVGTAIAAGIALNLRYVLITASLRELYQSLPFWRRALGAWFSTDENWALTLAARNAGEKVGYWFLVGAGVAILAAWLVAGAAGALLGGFLPAPETIAIDFAFTAAFIALARGLWRGRPDLVPYLVATVMAGGPTILGLMDPTAAVLSGGLAGAAAAALRPPGPAT